MFLEAPGRRTLAEATCWVCSGGMFAVLGGQANLRGVFAWILSKQKPLCTILN